MSKRKRKIRSDVKPECDHVAVANFVFLSFKPKFSQFARLGERAEGNQIVEGNRLGRDETAFEVGVDRARSRWRFVAGVNGPGPGFLFAGREIGAQAKQVISRSNQGMNTAVLHAKAAQIFQLLVFAEVGQL